MPDPITINAGDSVLGGTADDSYVLPASTDVVGSALVDVGGVDVLTLEDTVAALAGNDAISVSTGVLTLDLDGDSASDDTGTFEGIETLITNNGTLELSADSGTQYLVAGTDLSPAANIVDFGGISGVVEFDAETGTASNSSATWEIASVAGADFASGFASIDEGTVVFGADNTADVSFIPNGTDLTLDETREIDVDITYQNDAATPESFTETYTLTMVGTDNGGDDVIMGDADAADDYSGGSSLGDGDDIFIGRGGDDDADGDAGADTLVGGDGVDTLNGGDGDDELFGGAGNDDGLNGNAGADKIFGNVGDDTLDGGDGNDALMGGDGVDDMSGGGGNDKLFGGAGVDTMDGGAGDDVVYGGAGEDVITNTDGRDKLFGGADDDIITGGADIDTIVGGAGNDTLSGGLGNDIFVSYAGSGMDFILDWNAGDQIDVSSMNLSEAELTAALSEADLIAAGSVDFTPGADATNDDTLFVHDDVAVVIQDTQGMGVDDFIL